jgi:uncharacterized SAM-binding protein YcdF (DUF218 family)
MTMGELAQIAANMNVLAGFLGVRDLKTLTRDTVVARYGYDQADVMALFGGSILAGGDVLADAIRAGVARTYVIVGGAGHTTETFRARVRGLCPDLAFPDDAPEADVFEKYLEKYHGLRADLLETRSTNCGNNVTYLRDFLAAEGVACQSLIIAQDATMQRRMQAEVEKEMPGVTPINYATYRVRVVERGGGLAYEETPLGMWKPERYLTLLMGEIPRLTDDEHGYGPRGAGYLAHMDIPDEVTAAWECLRAHYPDSVRVANPAFAS